MKSIFHMAIAMLFFASCNTDSLNESSFENVETNIRKAPNMAVSITKPDLTVVQLTTSRVHVVHTFGNQFTLVVNYGMPNAISYTCILASINEPDHMLEVIKSPGNTPYPNKTSCIISANAVDKLLLNIQPGNISTNAVSIIGEEDDAI